jgi:hypothetical protein
MNLDPTVIGAIVVGIIVVILGGRFFFGSARRHGEGMAEQELQQLRIDQLARGTEEERWHAVGASARRASGIGCLGKLVLLGIFILIALALFDAFVGGGQMRRGILGR